MYATAMSLVVESLSYEYLQGKSVLNDFSLDVGDQEIAALVGCSGCGKTTLLHCIAGLLTPSSGTVTIDGNKVTHLKSHERSIGIMMQDQPLYEHLSVEQNIGFPLRARGEKAVDVSELIAELQLESVASKRVSRCSGGERRRVAFGRAVVANPKVLLLDEPFVSVHEEIRETIRAYVCKVRVTTLLVTHDQDETTAFTDRQFKLN
ncbi:MAG: ATP-binding cassette domain-containing protein [Phycisphaerales bacterium]|nr:ATP-binding cassette domain-containing protein [Phycisphaerales bacterium]